MRRIDIFVSSPEDVQKERSLVERAIRSIAGEFNVPVTVTYSNWLRKLNTSDKAAAQSANGSEDGRTWLCPCFWEYQDSELDQDYKEQIPNTGSYNLVISILWSRLGSKLSPAFIMPDGSTPKTANEYEIAWVLDQLNRTPGFPELRVYRNRSIPPAPLQPRGQREAFFQEWDAVQEFFAVWEKQSAFADARSDYSDLQEFENLFGQHFRDFLTRQLKEEIVPRKRPLIGQVWEAEPFQGLQSFDFEHAPIFHGRTKAVGQVLDVLNEQVSARKPFVLVLGATGSGKSSLVQAGVLPLLTEVGTVAGQGPWRRARTRPGFDGDPFGALAAALLADRALPELQKGKSREERQKLAGDLQADPDSVALRIKELLDLISAQELDRLLSREEDPSPGRIESVELARHRKLRRAKPKAQLALFIDQLEDIFTSGLSLELQQRYVAAVAALVRCQKIHVIAALRSDFYTSYQRFPELVALTSPNGRFDLQPPSREELIAIIRSPAEASGLRFDRDLKTGRALDETLAEAALGSTDPLPLLEHLLSQLYRKQAERKDGLLRWADYQDLRELEGALVYHAERVFNALNSDARQAFDFVIRRLVSLEPDERACSRPVPYRDLVRPHKLASRSRADAKTLVDSMVKEGLFSAETDYKREVMIDVAHPALLQKWPRVREWLIEDREFLRMRDRVNGCLKFWLKRGRQTRDLLSPGLGLADGATLLNRFHASLSDAQIEYIQKSLAEQKRGRRITYIVGFPVLIALTSLAAIAGIHWLSREVDRAILQEYDKRERKIAELVGTDHSGNQVELKQAEENARLAQQRAELATTQRSAMEAQLRSTQEQLQLAQHNADLASTQRAALETQLKQTQDNLQLAQQNAEVVSSRRSALEAELKQAQDKLQKNPPNSATAPIQNSALEARIKQAEEKAELVQRNAELAVAERSASEVQLKQAQDKLQQAEQSAKLASTQRSALEVQLKQAQDKLQQAEQSAELASTRRSALEDELKQAQDKLQQAQQRAEQASTQRSALEAQLKQAQDKLQEAQQSAELSSTQRSALEDQLKQAQDKLQQAQQSGELTSSQSSALEAQLKLAED
jgi:hypothetical protein